MKKVAILLLGTAVLTGCGSDDSGDSNDHRASSSYIGAIEVVSPNFDSIEVNSMTLDLSHAKVELNGSTFEESLLSAGMFVDVEYDNGVAYEVDIEPTMIGEVTEVTQSTITVNGQILPTKTSFVDKDLLNKNAMLFGYVDKDNKWVIIAGYDLGSSYRFDLHQGKISSEPTNTSFNIDSLVVDYSNNSIDSEDRRDLTLGAWVEVEGTYDNASKEFIADDVDVEDDLDLSNVEIEGYITTINADKTSMTLNGRTEVTITENTRFFKEDLHGDDVASDKSILEPGAKIDVDLINKNGILEATEIELDNDND
ncbi:DUF5666 domain-containing protein [Aliivibrio logei]|uniref:DUF5666 domain-containing protein n=1 Tax=Aliivibrio logei TaxID=688 RepID=UPI0035C91E7D